MQVMLDGVIQIFVDELFVHGICLQQNQALSVCCTTTETRVGLTPGPDFLTPPFAMHQSVTLVSGVSSYLVGVVVQHTKSVWPRCHPTPDLTSSTAHQESLAQVSAHTLFE